MYHYCIAITITFIYESWLFLTFGYNLKEMLIERTTNDQITITVSSSIDSFGLQRLIDYIKYLEAT